LPPQEIGSGSVRTRRELWALDEVKILPVPRNGVTIEGKGDLDGEAVLLIDVGRSSGIISIEKWRASRRIGRDYVRVDELAEGRLPTWHNQVALPLGPSRRGDVPRQNQGERPLATGLAHLQRCLDRLTGRRIPASFADSEESTTEPELA
jgi:hypothetical protein